MKTKEQIIEAIVRKLGLRLNVTEAVVNAFIGEIIEAVVKGETVQFRRFGIFEPKELAAKAVANPQTGERMELPKRKSVKFKPSSTFRNRIEGVQNAD